MALYLFSLFSFFTRRERPGLTLRAATSSDLDAITALGLAALPDDPIWPYRFTGAKKYPDDHYKFSRLRFSEYLDNVEAGVYSIMVIEAPSAEDQSVSNLIAMSFWALPGGHLPDPEQAGKIKPPTDHPERRDANRERMLEFRRQLGIAKTRCFDGVYGNKAMNLMILATHPDHRRQGAGTMLMKWGLEKAGREDIPITLFSSVMGFGLYTKLGFETVATVHVQVEGEEEFIDLPAMVWTPTTA